MCSGDIKELAQYKAYIYKGTVVDHMYIYSFFYSQMIGLAELVWVLSDLTTK